jgi:hypothetical protein
MLGFEARLNERPFTYCYHSVIAISLKELFHSQSDRIKGVRLPNILCLWIDELIRLGVSTVETNRDRDRERPTCRDELF